MNTPSNLTPRQQLIWIEQSLAPGVPSNNLAATFHIDGPVDPDRMRDSLQQAVDTYDSLRRVFEDTYGVPQQRVLDRVPVDLEFFDLSDHDNADEQLMEIVRARAGSTFDLGRGGLDAALIRLGPNHSVWYLALHQIAGDTWSLSLIYQRVAKIYAGANVDPPPQYATLLDAERRSRSSFPADASSKFWASRSAGSNSRLVPYGVKRTDNRASFQRKSVKLGVEHRNRIEALAAHHKPQTQREELTAFVGVAAVLFAYLHRVTGATNLAIAAPMSTRDTDEELDCIGTAMEVGIFRANVQPEDTFDSLLAKVVSEVDTVLPNIAFWPDGSRSDNEFDVLLNVNAARFPPFAGFATRGELFTGLNAVQSTYWNRPDFLHLQVHDFAGTGELNLDFDFDAELLDADLCDRAVGHFLTILDGLLEQPDMSISELPMASESEREQILDSLAGRRDPAPEVHDWLARFTDGVARHPDKTAVRFETERLTYRDLASRADNLAYRLAELGIGPGKRVGVLLERSIDTVIAPLAVWKTGAGYVPADPLQTTRTSQIIQSAGLHCMVTTRSLEHLTEGISAPIVYADEPVEAAQSALSSPAPDDVAYVVYTSGSTGKPKGVEIAYAPLLNLMLAMEEMLDLGPDDRLLAVTTVTFDIAAFEALGPLLVGAEIDVLDAASRVDGYRLRYKLAANGYSVMFATPTTWQMLLEAGWEGDPNLRILCGGELLTKELARELLPRCRELWNVYGPTETTIVSTRWRVTQRDLEDPRAIPVGEPLRDNRVYVLDAAGNPVPTGTPGDLYIAGGGVATGYLGDPDLTAERFLPCPFEEPGKRMYRTGDRAILRADGVLEYLGREDSQVKLHGVRVELGEIETALRRSASVSEAVVALHQTEEGDDRLEAFVAFAPGQSRTVSQLRDHLRATLPAYMVPARFYRLDELPLTETGKLDRQAVAGRNYAPLPQDDEQTAERAGNDLELSISLAWKSVLDLEQLGVNDNFFDLGGNSLLVIRLVNQLHEQYELDVTLGDLFEHPTVRGLAQNIGHHSIAKGASTILLKEGQPGPPLFCICGIHIYHQLAEALDDARSVYGIYIQEEADSLLADASAGAPPLSVEKLASEYLQAIRGVQPEGPYLLAGLSFGGLLAYEIAQQLRAQGEEVSLLAMMDTLFPAGIRWKPLGWFGSRLRTLIAWSMRLESVRISRRYGLRARIRSTFGGEAPPDDDGTIEIAELRARLFEKAMVSYQERIEPYSGEVVMFQAANRSGYEGYDVNLRSAWAPFIGDEFEVYDLPADHTEILETPHVASLADRLSLLLKEALD